MNGILVDSNSGEETVLGITGFYNDDVLNKQA